MFFLVFSVKKDAQTDELRVVSHIYKVTASVGHLLHLSITYIFSLS